MKNLIKLLFIPLNLSTAWAQSTADIQSWLDSHNGYRLKHQVAALEWSATLAQSAQNFVNTCPSGHSNSGYGENLAFASYTQTPSGVVDRWYSEEPSYNYNNPSFSAGHFTQVVWKSTTKVGCAQINTCAGSWSSIAVCQYDPPGNYFGRFTDNVFPPVNDHFSDSFE